MEGIKIKKERKKKREPCYENSNRAQWVFDSSNQFLRLDVRTYHDATYTR